MIAIVTDRVDPHADVLVGTLRGMGHEPVRVNSADLPLDTTLTVTLDGAGWSGSLVVEANRRVLDWRAVRSVWWRRPRGFGLSAALTEDERRFAEAELTAATGGIWACVDAYWMSRPEAIRAAGYKIEQLRRAAAYGLEVPRTLVTTDPGAVREFAASCGPVVYKVLTDPHVGAGVVLTTLLDPDADLSSVRNVPCLFQEHVPKRAEHRVTVIGDDVFVAEVVSPAVDWRSGEARWRVGRLPDDVLDRCVALVRSYGLEFSALDLIETPDGRHVFLENNPSGQFLFVEERLPQLRMAGCLAARLVEGCR
jgi:hypothetical protein